MGLLVLFISLSFLILPNKCILRLLALSILLGMMPQSLFVVITIAKELALFGKDANQCQIKEKILLQDSVSV